MDLRAGALAGSKSITPHRKASGTRAYSRPLLSRAQGMDRLHEWKPVPYLGKDNFCPALAPQYGTLWWGRPRSMSNDSDENSDFNRSIEIRCIFYSGLYTREIVC
jgi:hypothetical protein